QGRHRPHPRRRGGLRGHPLRAGAGGGQDPADRRARDARSRLRRPGSRRGDGARASSRGRRLELLRLRGHQRRARPRARMRGAPAAASPRLFAATVSNAAGGELAIAYRLGGPSVTLTAGGASGIVALGHAADLVRSGRADALVAGGADALDDDLRRWLAAGGLDPGRAPAEGAAVLVLERAELARARGRAILGTVEGVAAGFEPEPAGARAGEGLAAAVATAPGEAGGGASEIRGLVEAGPPAVADLESRALGGGEPRTVVHPKDALGETFGAAGALGALAALAEAP